MTADDSAPTFGIEEEFFLTDAVSGALREDANQIRASASQATAAEVDHELRTAMLEIGTAVCHDLDAARADLTRKRQALVQAADQTGAHVLATATHPTAIPDAVGYTDDPRYQRMAAQFGQLADEALVCGCHVHVRVPSRPAAVHVVDRIRPWLAPLIALSANGPFWRDRDTGYDSWRTHMWARWPTAGPAPVFGGVDAYDSMAEALISSGAALDRGMLYFEARPSEQWPTIEVRVADVCLEVEDAVLVAAVTRALVMTALGNTTTPPTDVPVGILRAASFAASRSGLQHGLVDPLDWRLGRPADVLGHLVAHVSDALDQTGDTSFVRSGIERLLSDGNGASRQRRAYAGGGQAALHDLVRLR